MDAVVRKAELKDTKEANNLLTMLIRDEKQYDPSINENCVISRFYEDMILNDSNILLVAEIDNKIIGYLYGYIVDNGNTYLDKVSKLDALYITKEYRKNKIATKLINEFKSWSLKNGVKYIEVQVLNDNINAINLYKKEGFGSFKATLINKIQ